MSGTAAAAVKPPQQKRHRQTTSDIIPIEVSSTGQICNAARNTSTDPTQLTTVDQRPQILIITVQSLLATPLRGRVSPDRNQPTHYCASESSRRVKHHANRESLPAWNTRTEANLMTDTRSSNAAVCKRDRNRPQYLLATPPRNVLSIVRELRSQLPYQRALYSGTTTRNRSIPVYNTHR